MLNIAMFQQVFLAQNTVQITVLATLSKRGPRGESNMVRGYGWMSLGLWF